MAQTPDDPIVTLPAGSLPTFDLTALAGEVGQALAAGGRLLTLYGRPATAKDGGGVTVTAVLLPMQGPLRVLRAHAQAGQAYPAITAQHPAAQMAERELWEQTGLQPEGHPWLKPVRFEGARQQHLDDYPFFKVRGQEVHEVGVGPIHASVIEPGHFRFMCHGEQVQHLEIQLGYQHRGLEALMLQRPTAALTPLVETIAGDTSIAHAWAHCAAIEGLSGTPVSPEAERVRGMALELERVAMHLVAITGLATDIAFLQGGTTCGRLRTAIINATMRVCGSRFGRGWLRPGGVRFGITEALRTDLQTTLAAFARDMAEVADLMLSARSVRSRFQGVGRVGRDDALGLGLVGLVARSSGVALDLRSRLPGAFHSAHPVALLTADSGDCWARFELRLREIDESTRWLQQMLQSGPDLAAPPITPLAPLAPDSLSVSLREGFRGPVLHALETGADGRLLHAKLQDPSMLNWFGLALSLRGNEISDFPICNKSFDLSYCGNDL
jgi:Ni,Fe-hydrogenase III large subunit